MSIATDITGAPVGSSVNQLLELLANPDAYAAKIKAMEAATAEYKTYVEAVGVATEINNLRDQAKALREEAQAYRDAALAQADADIKTAEAKAATILAEAQQKANELTSNAQAVKSQSDALMNQASALMDQAKAAQAKATADQAAADAQSKRAADTQAQLDSDLAAAQALKDDIVAKHQAFIQGL